MSTNVNTRLAEKYWTWLCYSWQTGWDVNFSFYNEMNWTAQKKAWAASVVDSRWNVFICKRCWEKLLWQNLCKSSEVFMSTLHTTHSNNLFILIQLCFLLCHRCTVHFWPRHLQKSVTMLCALTVNMTERGKKEEKSRIFWLSWRSRWAEQDRNRQTISEGRKSESLSLSPLTAVSI